MAADLVCFGEGMVELSGLGEGSARIAFGGDTLNTAVYAARLGAKVAYATALGDDQFSRDMREAWAGEGVDLALTLTIPGALPGLYAVRTDARGERSFSYWRSASAARGFFSAAGADAALAAMRAAPLLYLSGITLSIFSADERGRIAGLCADVRERGGEVAFDPNCRPRGWPSPAEARAAVEAIAPHVDIALPTFDDEAALFADAGPAAAAERWRAWGVREVVVKQGGEGCWLSSDDHGPPERAPVPAPVDPVDTTGAGDSFNAAYVQARLSGADPMSAARAGHRLAAAVIGHAGAIIPRAAMPAGQGVR